MLTAHGLDLVLSKALEDQIAISSSTKVKTQQQQYQQCTGAQKGEGLGAGSEERKFEAGIGSREFRIRRYQLAAGQWFGFNGMYEWCLN